jgi:hypothetical protein
LLIRGRPSTSHFESGGFRVPDARAHLFISALRVRAVALVAALIAIAAPDAAYAAPASAPVPVKVVRYHGYRVVVPANWPVYRLDKDPTACVRFNRHALYLGRPGADQRCPVHAAGRTEAILVEPLSGPRALEGASPAATDQSYGSLGQLIDRMHDVAVTATWNAEPSLITRALGVRSVSSLAATARVRPAAWRRADSARYGVRAAAAAATPGEVYTGAAFDACSTPSSRKMAAWGASRFRALGVYIGGTNMACSQPNLTGDWVVQQSAWGWHLIPIYVGLQAPMNSCGCAAISPRAAAGEGNAAAVDAVAQAQAIDLGPGNPIYYDMEAYARKPRNTRAVLAFLQAWTNGLHAAGYKSGIYSSEYSGIEDLVNRAGAAYAEPDDIWVANWNGVRSTYDPILPSADWASHQRIHQFAGDHNERHGRVTINIDSDYVDAATAAAGSAAPATVIPATVPGTRAAAHVPHGHTARRRAHHHRAGRRHWA